MLFTSEAVTAGHPDKVCDQIADAVLDAILAEDPEARVACEAVIGPGMLWILGEVTARADVDIEALARQTIVDLGYDSIETGFDGRACGILISLHGQSPDIAKGVEQRGAGDQGMMFGYARTDTEALMPLPVVLAHQICRNLDEARVDGSMPYLRPDGKAQVTIRYDGNRPVGVEDILISSQHSPEVERREITEDLIERVAKPAVRETCPRLGEPERYLINPTGRFVSGGPMADSGMTGRKVAVDTYGAMARHGGGAFSGKDPTKVDRSAAYYTRYVAKNIVAAGLAEIAEVQVAYAIGIKDPISVWVDTFGTGTLPDDELLKLVRANFNFQPNAIIEELDLRRPIYQQTARYGAFGRSDLDLPWEAVDAGRFGV